MFSYIYIYIDGSSAVSIESTLNYSPIIRREALMAVSVVYCNVEFMMRFFNQTLSIHVLPPKHGSSDGNNANNFAGPKSPQFVSPL